MPRNSALGPSDLESLTSLYANGKLQPGRGKAYEADAALNDKIILWRGDITKLAVDAIVNAANKSLLGGGGVDGAIHSAAGPGLLGECKQLNGAGTGQVKITGGHGLPAKHVLHAVGPIYKENKQEQCEQQLRSCYRNALGLLVENGLRTIAFPGISTGIYGYPLDDATQAALDEVRQFLQAHADQVDYVIFTVFRPIDVESYEEYLPVFFPPASTPPRPIPQPSSSQKLSDIHDPPPESDDPSAHPGSSPVARAAAASDPRAMTDQADEGHTVALPKQLGGVKKSLAKEAAGPEETVKGEVAKGETVEDA